MFYWLKFNRLVTSYIIFLFRMILFSEALPILMITTHMAGSYNDFYREKTDDILFRCCRIFWDLSLIISWLQICWSISLPRHKGPWGRSVYKEKTLTNGKFVLQALHLSVCMCVYMCVNLINMWNTHPCMIIISIPFLVLTYTMLNTNPCFSIILGHFLQNCEAPWCFGQWSHCKGLPDNRNRVS